VRAFVAERQREEKDDNGKVTKRAASNAEINRELAALRRAFRLAVRAGRLVQCPHVPMLREQNVRRGFLEPVQIAAICAALPEPLRPIVKFAYATGWRTASEVLPLEWRNVDRAGRCVRLDPGTTKNGEGRSFPFTADIEKILKDQLAIHEALKKADKVVLYVFNRNGERIWQFRTSWKNACKAAGCPGKLIRDMRRSAVRTFERAGVPRSVATSIVGHKTESIYRRYAIVDEAMQREAAARLHMWASGPQPDQKTGTVATSTPKQPRPRSRVANKPHKNDDEKMDIDACVGGPAVMSGSSELDTATIDCRAPHVGGDAGHVRVAIEQLPARRRHPVHEVLERPNFDVHGFVEGLEFGRLTHPQHLLRLAIHQHHCRVESLSEVLDPGVCVSADRRAYAPLPVTQSGVRSVPDVYEGAVDELEGHFVTARLPGCGVMLPFRCQGSGQFWQTIEPPHLVETLSEHACVGMRGDSQDATRSFGAVDSQARQRRQSRGSWLNRHVSRMAPVSGPDNRIRFSQARERPRVDPGFWCWG
jgi:integrase